MTLKKCSVIGCSSNGALHPELPMFKFPRDLERCRMWVKIAGNAKLLESPSRKLALRNYLCAHHFTEDQFFDKFRRRLRRTAIPSLVSCKPLSNDVMSPFPVLESSELVGSKSTEEKNALDNACSSLLKHSGDNDSQPQSLPKKTNLLETLLNSECDDGFAQKEKEDCCPSLVIVPPDTSNGNPHTINQMQRSITYIEGPWSSHIQDEQSFSSKPFSMRIFDENAEITTRLLLETNCLEHCASQNIQEIVVHHVDIKTDERKEHFTRGSHECCLDTPPFFEKETQSSVLLPFCPASPLPICDPFHTGTNQPPLDSSVNFVFQNKQLNSGAHVQVISNCPVALKR